jgi:hypothetical protein
MGVPNCTAMRILCSAVSGLALLAAAGCTPVRVPDGAVMPVNLGGTPVMSDEGAMQLSAYALGVPSRTAGDAVNGARAIASIDYLAAALYLNPRWDYVSITTKAQMVRGRTEEREVLGIDPRAPTQEVVDRLMAVASAMEGRNVAAAQQALTSPAFTFGPQRTLAMLTNLPYLPDANVAAQKANLESTPPSGHCGIFPCS